MDEPFLHDSAEIRTVVLGGVGKSELIEQLKNNDISMNVSAERLVDSDLFTTAETPYTVATVDLTPRDLGFPEGAVIDDIYAKAGNLGLGLCPIELGPHMRLQYTDQPEGYVRKPVREHQAPFGSLSITSAPLSDNDDFPKGFYLRTIDGVLWLRGYRSGPDHV